MSRGCCPACCGTGICCKSSMLGSNTGHDMPWLCNLSCPPQILDAGILQPYQVSLGRLLAAGPWCHDLGKLPRQYISWSSDGTWMSELCDTPEMLVVYMGLWRLAITCAHGFSARALPCWRPAPLLLKLTQCSASGAHHTDYDTTETHRESAQDWVCLSMHHATTRHCGQAADLVCVAGSIQCVAAIQYR